MFAGESTLVGSSKGCLKSKHEGDPQLVKYGNSSCRILGFRHRKCAVLKIEVVELLREHHRENRRRHRIWASLSRGRKVLHLVAVLENVLLDRVAVKIKIKEKLLVFDPSQSIAQLFGVVDRRMKSLTRFCPFPIQITSRQRTSIIPVYDSVDV